MPGPHLRRQSGPGPALVAYHRPQSAGAEAFRVLRTNLQFMGLDEPLKSFVVTSPAPGEGKSTLAGNLAVVFAQTGANVCLVDADLRRPTMAKLFGVDPWMGLSQAVAGGFSLEDCLCATAVAGLSLITSGPLPPNPAELLGSARMLDLVRRLEAAFDLVIIDAPPLLAVTDAAVLAPHLGGALLVARSGRTDRRELQQARAALESVHARVLGIALQAAPVEARDDYYGTYGTDDMAAAD